MCAAFKRWVSGTAVLALTAACGPASVPGADGGPDGGGNAGGVALSVSASRVVPVIGGMSPPSGRQYVVVDLTVMNASVPTPIMTNIAMYSLTTDAALVLRASLASGLLAAPCPSDTMLAVGGMLACQLAFEVPTAQNPVTLSYDDHQGHTAMAAVPGPSADTFIPTCTQYCPYLRSARTACSSCLSSSCPAEHQSVMQAQAADRTGYSSWAGCFGNAPFGGCTSVDGCAAIEMCTPSTFTPLYQALWACEVAACSAVCP
jgi:hypothetical protein